MIYIGKKNSRTTIRTVKGIWWWLEPITAFSLTIPMYAKAREKYFSIVKALSE